MKSKDEQLREAAEKEYPASLYPESFRAIYRTAAKSDAARSYHESVGWISVEERIDIKGGNYLVVNPNSQPPNEIEVAFYRNYNGMFVKDSGDIIHPSFYRPLPNPPKTT